MGTSEYLKHDDFLQLLFAGSKYKIILAFAAVKDCKSNKHLL